MIPEYPFLEHQLVNIGVYKRMMFENIGEFIQ